MGEVAPDPEPDKTDDPTAGDEEEDTCPAEPCDLYTQCGCGEGEACDLDAAAFESGGTECRAATAGAQSQASCTTSEDCAAGYGCFGSPGQCRKYCDGDGDCGFGYCSIQITYRDAEGDVATVPDATVCTKACKPESATGSGCPQDPTFGCFFYQRDPNGAPDSGDEYWYTDCRPAASTGGRHDADCSDRGDSDCAPGYNCLVITYSDGTKADRCRQTCVWAVAGEPGSRSCASGRTCNSLGITVGDTEYGACR